MNYNGQGELLGEFQSEDKILVVNSKGEYYLSGFEDTNHFEEDIKVFEKFDPEKVWTVALFDANEGYKYLKRFRFEVTSKRQNFIGENPKSQMLLITDTFYPRLNVVFGGADAHRVPMEIDADEFIGVKGMKAKGKRIHTWEIQRIEELEPVRFPEKTELPEGEPEEEGDGADDNTDNPQLSLF